jgi:hypothetical protein
MRMIWILVTLSLAASGCAYDGWVQTEYEKGDDFEVYVEHRVESETTVPQAFAHPAEINPRAISAILSGLRFWESNILGDQSAEPVFQPYEVEQLAPRIFNALTEIGPDQRVRFISKNTGRALILASRRITRGVVFVKPENVLNIAFIEINEDLYPMDYAEMGRERDMREPTNIKSSVRALAKLPWYDLNMQPDGEEPYPLWCMVDLGSEEVSAVTAPPAAAPPETAEPGEQPIVRETPAVSPEDAELRSKLKLLKELHEDGLITEEEYQRKKADLLENL